MSRHLYISLEYHTKQNVMCGAFKKLTFAFKNKISK